MPLPIPGPSTVVNLTRSALGHAAGSAATVAGLPARAFGLLDGAEELLRRAGAVLSRVESTLDSTDALVGRAQSAVQRVEAVLGDAEGAVNRVQGVVTDAEVAVQHAGTTLGSAAELLTTYEPTLRRAAPMASRFVEQLSPEEVDAAIRLVDELPTLTEHLLRDILPILATLDRVGPDIHDLLNVTRDLKLAVAGIPGLRMLRRRGEERLAADETAAGEAAEQAAEKGVPFATVPGQDKHFQ